MFVPRGFKEITIIGEMSYNMRGFSHTVVRMSENRQMQLFSSSSALPINDKKGPADLKILFPYWGKQKVTGVSAPV